MNYSERLGLIVGLISGFLLGVVVGGSISAAESSHEGHVLFRAERACRPGMLLYLTENRSRAVCIGGRGETWVVTP